VTPYGVFIIHQTAGLALNPGHKESINRLLNSSHTASSPVDLLHKLQTEQPSLPERAIHLVQTNRREGMAIALPPLPFNPTRLRSYILRLPLFTRIVLILIAAFWVLELQTVWSVVAWGALIPSEVGIGTSGSTRLLLFVPLPLAFPFRFLKLKNGKEHVLTRFLSIG
jgi:hypothetical protein